jgi:hypothetical protein
VEHVRSQLAVSERRACAVISQSRTTQRRQPKVRRDEAALTDAIVRLATRYGRYSYRRIRRPFPDEGWQASGKHVYRIWRRQGLKVADKQPKRGRLRLNEGSCIRQRPERPAQSRLVPRLRAGPHPKSGELPLSDCPSVRKCRQNVSLSSS